MNDSCYGMPGWSTTPVTPHNCITDRSSSMVLVSKLFSSVIIYCNSLRVFVVFSFCRSGRPRLQPDSGYLVNIDHLVKNYLVHIPCFVLVYIALNIILLCMWNMHNSLYCILVFGYFCINWIQHLNNVGISCLFSTLYILVFGNVNLPRR